MDITLGMATGGTVRSETLVSVIGALDVVKKHGVGVHLNVEIGGYVARNRNQVVEEARKNGSSHILFVDNDMEFKPSAFQRLIDADKDIIGVNYNARGIPGQPIISTVKLGPPEPGSPISTKPIPQHPFRCYAVGTGLTLINIRVFDGLLRPYFVAFEEEDGTHHTEDVEFCRKAAEAGFEVWCNPTIEVSHIGTAVY